MYDNNRLMTTEMMTAAAQAREVTGGNFPPWTIPDPITGQPQEPTKKVWTWGTYVEWCQVTDTSAFPNDRAVTYGMVKQYAKLDYPTGNIVGEDSSYCGFGNLPVYQVDLNWWADGDSCLVERSLNLGSTWQLVSTAMNSGGLYRDNFFLEVTEVWYRITVRRAGWPDHVAGPVKIKIWDPCGGGGPGGPGGPGPGDPGDPRDPPIRP